MGIFKQLLKEFLHSLVLFTTEKVCLEIKLLKRNKGWLSHIHITTSHASISMRLRQL